MFHSYRTFHYGTIKTETAAAIECEYEAKIAEYEKKCPVFFMAHDARNESAPAKYNKLFSLIKYLKDGEVINTQKFSFANHTTAPHEKVGLVPIFCETLGISEDTCKKIFGPHNAANNAVITYIIMLFKLWKEYHDHHMDEIFSDN